MFEKVYLLNKLGAKVSSMLDNTVIFVFFSFFGYIIILV